MLTAVTVVKVVDSEWGTFAKLSGEFRFVRV
jgi:hypothetical protein